MAKAEWGTKRTCPKCSERFYDLTKNNPCVCIECGTSWVPEPVLKTKQPIVVEKEEEEEDDEESEDAIVAVADSNDDDDENPLGDVSLDDDDDAEVSGMVDTTLSSDDA